jgi:hypothetical protein
MTRAELYRARAKEAEAERAPNDFIKEAFKIAREYRYLAEQAEREGW